MLSKHIIGLIVVGLALSLTIGAISYSNTSDAAFTDGDWTFTVTGGNATIVSNTDTEVSILNIPSTVTAYDTTYPVTAIGDGTYTWSIVNDGGTGVNVTADGRIYGTAGNVTVSPATVTARLTGTVDGATQTKDCTFQVIIVAKLIFTTNPINDGVIA